MSPAVAPATQRVAESFALRLDAPDGSTTGLVSNATGGVISASVIRHQSLISWPVTMAPSTGTTHAQIASPRTSSGTPTTAASRTAGWA